MIRAALIRKDELGAPVMRKWSVTPRLGKTVARSLGRRSKKILRRHDSFTFEDNDRGMAIARGVLMG